MTPKSILMSKTFIVNLLTITTVVAASYGITPDQEIAEKTAAALILLNPIINIILRYFTTKPVVIFPETPEA
jgi:hypothetical protein